MIRSSLALGTLAVALLSAAHATSTADTTLSDFHITLTDLDAADGIAPSLAFDPSSRSAATAAAVAFGGSLFWQQLGASPFGPVSSSGAMHGIGGSASFAGDPFGAGATLSAHGEAVPGLADGIGEDYVNTQTDGLTSISSFVLSPQTQVSFTGLESLAWNASDPRAAAYGEVQLLLFQWLDGEQTSISMDDFLDGWGAGANAAQIGSESRKVSVTFANATDAAVTVDYGVLVSARASEVDVPPTPMDEPGSAWLLLAGALPLAWRARRRIN